MKPESKMNTEPANSRNILLATVFQLKSLLKIYWGLGVCLLHGTLRLPLSCRTQYYSRWSQLLKAVGIVCRTFSEYPNFFILHIAFSKFRFCPAFLFSTLKTSLISQLLSVVNIYARQPLHLFCRQTVSYSSFCILSYCRD